MIIEAFKSIRSGRATGHARSSDLKPVSPGSTYDPGSTRLDWSSITEADDHGYRPLCDGPHPAGRIGSMRMQPGVNHERCCFHGDVPLSVESRKRRRRLRAALEVQTQPGTPRRSAASKLQRTSIRRRTPHRLRSGYPSRRVSTEIGTIPCCWGGLSGFREPQVLATRPQGICAILQCVPRTVLSACWTKFQRTRDVEFFSGCVQVVFTKHGGPSCESHS